MSVNLDIQAEVVDIKSDVPQHSDIFLIDTNVWLWQTYPNAGTGQRNAQAKILDYGAYLKVARQNGSMLAYSGLILAELAHVIETTEYTIYKTRNSLSSLKIKEFRHNLTVERANVVNLVKSAWTQVKNLAVPVEITINDLTTDLALSRFQTQALDGYDLLILESISKADPGQIKIITDDMDYTVVPGIQVFTTNYLALQEATAKGKLLVR
ncbi:MAG: hypothetical protein MH252_04630 [Thermosynechococcaceae cyanobacterium MS004]|nr:hypothetical protein [Thermosynechococcaceae cyanobacterium MS004]